MRATPELVARAQVRARKVGVWFCVEDSPIMSEVKELDFTDTPASELRGCYHYESRERLPPLASIITPIFNTPPELFRETVTSIQRMSFVQWEWIVIDDGSTDVDTLAELERLRVADPRVRVIQQENAGPGIARNRAAKVARGKYLLQLDSDDLVEPTFLEKAIWVMETQPQFSAASAYTVTFGSPCLLWDHGFQEYEATLLQENMLTSQNVIRRDAFLESGGYDETLRHGHEDWDFWLNLAETGHWGYTIPEYLTWYRSLPTSRHTETSGDKHKSFRKWLSEKHVGLTKNFPRPVWLPSTDYPEATISQEIPVRNPLAKPEDKTRVLFLVPWLVVGGADKFNLDLVKTLTARGYEFTIATTLSSDNPWLHEFAKVTPDIFALQKFLAYADYPRFLDYLIESRQIDAILISQSQVGFGLVPYLRARHPNVAILDYLHVEEEHWKNGGYPGMAVRVGALIDRHVTCTHHLKRWMVKRGADPEAIDVCHANIDVNEWDPERVDTEDVRKRYDIPCDKPMVLFVGRIVDQKRPLVFAKIVHNLARRGAEFTAAVVGDGDLLWAMKQYIHSHKLDRYVRFLGTQPSAQVQQLQAAADIFLLPSKYEGLALVLYECMAMKTVPVTTDFGGHPELVTPDCGYLIGKSDDEVEAYATAVYELIRDPDRRNRMAEAGRRRVCDHFAIEHMADGMHEAISTVRGIATARTSEISTVELEMAHIAAHSAIEQFRLEVLTDYLWYVSHTTHRADFVRRMRQKALPIGTRRYEIYKFGRQGLRFMLRGARAGVSSGSAQREVGVDRDDTVTVAVLSEPISMRSVTMVEDVDAVTNVPSARPSTGANQ